MLRDRFMTVQDILDLDPAPSLRTVRRWIEQGVLGEPVRLPLRGSPAYFDKATVLRQHARWVATRWPATPVS